MKISLLEAYKLAKQSLGEDLKSVKVCLGKNYKGEEVIEWEVQIDGYHCETDEILFIAIQRATAELARKKATAVEDVEVEQKSEEREVTTTPKEAKENIF